MIMWATIYKAFRLLLFQCQLFLLCCQCVENGNCVSFQIVLSTYRLKKPTECFSLSISCWFARWKPSEPGSLPCHCLARCLCSADHTLIWSNLFNMWNCGISFSFAVSNKKTWFQVFFIPSKKVQLSKVWLRTTLKRSLNISQWSGVSKVSFSPLELPRMYFSQY